MIALVNVTYLTPLEFDAAAVGVALSLVAGCGVLAMLILSREDQPLHALVADDPQEVTDHAPMPRTGMRAAGAVRSTSLPRALVSGAKAAARRRMVCVAWWAWRGIRGAFGRNKRSDRNDAPAYQHPLDDDLREHHDDWASGRFTHKGEQDEDLPPVQPLGSEPDWPALPDDADVLATMTELAEQERVPSHEPDPGISLHADDCDDPDCPVVDGAGKCLDDVTEDSAPSHTRCGDPGPDAPDSAVTATSGPGDQPEDSAAAGNPSPPRTVPQPAAADQSAGELSPGEPWCRCGFTNTSTGPCEVCGTDPETGEVDHDFLDERRAEDSPGPANAGGVDDANPTTGPGDQPHLDGDLDPARFGVASARAWVEQYLIGDPWPVNA